MASTCSGTPLDWHTSSHSVSSLGSLEDLSTPPSSVATSPSSRRRTLSNDLSKEATEFLSDLENYLALGCLYFEDLVDLNACEGEATDDGWKDVNSIFDIISPNNNLFIQLQKLVAANWIRLRSRRSAQHQSSIIRVYLLPFDVGLRFVPERGTKGLTFALECVLAELDVRKEVWNGYFIPGGKRTFDTFALQDDGSLFYIFNTLPSPSPSASSVKEKYARDALNELLRSNSDYVLPGMKTKMYPFQKRSASLMLQRELVSTLELDPQLEERRAPDDSVFYFEPRSLSIYRQPRYYEQCRGGILAETMGLGKTVMCLATVVATRDHPPIIPAMYAEPPKKTSVPSLLDMTLSAINRKSFPWAVAAERRGDLPEHLREMLQANPPCYQISLQPQRWNRKTIVPPPKNMMLACTTLIVVPQNLCKQWQTEINKHIDEDVLRVLVMDSNKKSLPPSRELRTYDIVLFTRGRFEREINDGSDDQGRRIGTTQRSCQCPYIGATRERDCHCLSTDDLYDSPLKHLHFKRLIIDEGHFFANASSTAVQVANTLITVDHRWVVSGTPAKDLLGAEIEADMSTSETFGYSPGAKQSRDAVLKARQHFGKEDVGKGAIKSIGSLASSFLRIKPWYAESVFETKAEWDEHIYRHVDRRKKTYSGFSTCLRRTLTAMVVKTQPEDVERDIKLPGLHHEVVRLEPSYYDKLTANLFTLMLIANAVASERTDGDYLFHKNNQNDLKRLIQNLRQSAFFWTGFQEEHVQASLKNSHIYLDKEGTGCTESDRTLLIETMKCGNAVLESDGWLALSRSHEIGLFINDWPSNSAEHWSFGKLESPLLTGLSQLIEAQKHVNVRAGDEDPGEGLSGTGIRASAPAKYAAVKKEGDDSAKEKPILTNGIPTSSFDGEPILRRRGSVKSDKKSPRKAKSRLKGSNAPKKQRIKKSVLEDQPVSQPESRSEISFFPDGASLDSPLPSLPSDSPFLRSRVVGTTSAKLSYLTSQILKFYEEEKILIFYDGENVAYYIAQMLELLHIKHDIYAKTLTTHLKNEYAARFNEDPQYRVLLMDVRHAARGLNLPSASRVFFVNPMCRPDLEAQAIKRAHRIGQTREVFVETLVLKGTIEEKMLERSKRMTKSEHKDAKVLEDDGGIRDIIQSARMLPIYDFERVGAGQMASLEKEQQLWGRPGWQQSTAIPKMDVSDKKKRKREDDPKQVDLAEERPRPKKRVKRVLDFVDCLNTDVKVTNCAAGHGDNDELKVPSKRVRRRQRKRERERQNRSFTSQLTHRSEGVVLASPHFERLDQFSASASDADLTRISISQLIDIEPSSPTPIRPQILQEVLNRLGNVPQRAVSFA